MITNLITNGCKSFIVQVCGRRLKCRRADAKQRQNNDVANDDERRGDNLCRNFAGIFLQSFSELLWFRFKREKQFKMFKVN